MARDWSHEEVEAIAAAYFAMLAKELKHEPYSKAEYSRHVQSLLDTRSKQAIEYKHANISAVLHEIGYPAIEGYKRRSNYQALLRDVVLERVSADRALEDAVAAAVSAPVTSPLVVPRWEELVEDPPRGEKLDASVYERLQRRRAPTLHVDYLEREARNRRLGQAGEEFVLRAEEMRLLSAGRRDLASRIEHVSVTNGDGLGYDIHSFDMSGKDRLIEVKTTRFGATTPFFASSNEVAVSDELAEHYHLYRVFKFELQPRLFILPGALKASTELTPTIYRATLR